MTIADVDGDGIKDIAYADAQWGDMYGINATNGAEFWKMEYANFSGIQTFYKNYFSKVTHGVNFLLFDDFDNDGDLEVAYSGSGDDYDFFINNVLNEALFIRYSTLYSNKRLMFRLRNGIAML